jgi:hypothetical protein
MIALGMVYPKIGLKISFFHMGVLKATFCAPCKVGEFGQTVHALLSGQTFMR